MYSYFKLYKQKIISISLIICFILFCYINAILNINKTKIIDNDIPLNSPNIEALFYVRSASGSSELDTCTCIGDGLLSTNESITSDEDAVKKYILTSPDYTNYLPEGSTITWDTITANGSTMAVLGSVTSKNKVVPTIREYHQNDNYAPYVKQVRALVNPKKVYYFSTTGRDKNNGLSPDSPKKDPTEYIKAGNCKCLLKSGDTFYSYYGYNPNSNLVISTYGGNERACLSLIRRNIGPINNYDSSKNIYKVSLDKNSKDIGWLRINGTKTWKKVLSFNNLVNDKEYYVDRPNKCVYIKSMNNLEGQTVDYSCNWNGMNINGKQNLIIENIELSNAGSHGIHITSSSNVLINNCFIHDIGGAIQEGNNVKFGNGIEVWANACNNIIIYKNIINDCFDAGITAQIDKSQNKNTNDIYIINNLIERTNYGFECFHNSPQYTIKNLVVENNILLDSKDITGGYRLTFSSTDYTGFLCLWEYANANCNINITNNFGFKTQNYVASYTWKSAVKPPINYKDNLFITFKDPAIKNISNYTGDDTQYEIVEEGTELYNQYKELADSLKANYLSNKISE
ncbi:MAG: right-handed parallel beta-helix repeat-containing protein [Pseudobutyrivibrio ruminis]|uniref:Right-handed parallel beta-helix repeat-containing protein n=1 Tax=Pseudobutyrivibrio ruminis TaxID=46206 RepID=A0A927UDI0_9FIRM|nr:right-handed parallel beta-helix repeat-containing protein [Pseudobutyrivibrio ruminis]